MKLLQGSNSSEIYLWYYIGVEVSEDMERDWFNEPLNIVFVKDFLPFEWTLDQWFTYVRRPINILWDRHGNWTQFPKFGDCFFY